MNEPAPVTGPSPSVRAFAAETIFAALNDETRRRILAALVDGQFHASPGYTGGHPKERDVYRKHCAVLVKAGLIVGQEDPSMPRQSVYKLAPAVKVETGAAGSTLDFGWCVLRC